MYSGETLTIPKNLYILGTMNTADRSIALVDYAFRRRFFFVNMMPNEEILRKWLKKHLNTGPGEQEKIINLFKELNEKIRKEETLGENFQIGHTYFFVKDNKELEIQWKYAILPLVKEYLFEDTEKLEAYEKLWDEKSQA